MTRIREYGLLYWTVIGVLTLLVASPVLSRVLIYPQTEFFTELWILDSNHRAENYPFNITRNRNCNVFLGIGNHLGYCAYYLVEVKFRNQTQPEPTSFGPIGNRTPSPLPSLFNITAFVADGQVWELPLSFSFDYAYNRTLSKVMFHTLTLNDVTLNISDYMAYWDSSNHCFSGFLFFELWIYNETTSSFNYHGRFVRLHLNMTTF